MELRFLSEARFLHPKTWYVLRRGEKEHHVTDRWQKIHDEADGYKLFPGHDMANNYSYIQPSVPALCLNSHSYHNCAHAQRHIKKRHRVRGRSQALASCVPFTGTPFSAADVPATHTHTHTHTRRLYLLSVRLFVYVCPSSASSLTYFMARMTILTVIQLIQGGSNMTGTVCV